MIRNIADLKRVQNSTTLLFSFSLRYFFSFASQIAGKLLYVLYDVNYKIRKASVLSFFYEKKKSLSK